MPEAGDGLRADLVLEGGGVKGIALVGAVNVLAEAGYTFPRVAGSSAGAIVGALVASGMSPGRMLEVMRQADYASFRDPTTLSRFGPLGKGVSLLFHRGIYRGTALEEFLTAQLPESARSFAGLRLPPDEGSDLPADRRYRLVVMASDVSQRQLARLPWDYARRYGLVADERPVVEAVRASMSIPFFFVPAHLGHERPAADGTARRRSTLVDGGLLSNFPVDVFDRADGRRPRWPTFGIKLSGRVEEPPPTAVRGPVSLSLGMLATLLGWHDRAHIEDPAVCPRTIFIDTFEVSPVAFDLSREDQERLYQSGRDAATKFLDSWDEAEYVACYRSGTGARQPA